MREKEEISATFAHNLRTLRARYKVPCSTLSELCGLHRDAVRRYESQEQKPSFETAAAIAEYFEGVHGCENVLEYLAGEK